MEPNDGPVASVGTLTPSTSIEQIIAEIWANLLKQPHVDPQSNFFSLGGHSLLAIQCLARLRDKLLIRMSLSDFFENPTVAEQAALIRRRAVLAGGSSTDASPSWRLDHDGAAASGVAETIPPRDRSLPCPLSPNQRRLWFMESVVGGEPVYNEAEAVRLKGELKLEVLDKALNAVVARHENLRTSFRTIDGEPAAFVHDGWRLKVKHIDLSSLTPAEREAEVQRLLIDEPRRPYKLDTEPAIRVTLLRLGPTDHILILMMHHLICDWGSTGNLWRDLSTSYRAGCRGLPLELSVLSIQHGDYAVWQHDLSTRATFAEDLAYWQEKLRGAPSAARASDGSTSTSRPFLPGRKTTLSDPDSANASSARMQSQGKGKPVHDFCVGAKRAALSLHRTKRHPLGHPALRPGSARNCKRLSAFCCIRTCCERRLTETCASDSCCFACKKTVLIFMLIALRPSTRW